MGIVALLMGVSGVSAATPTPTTSTPAAQISGSTVPSPPLPRGGTAVTVTQGNQTVTVQPIVTARAADGREAVAGRILVGFRSQVSDSEKADVHRSVSARAIPQARAVEKVTPQTDLADVSGAPSLEVAIRAYLADPRVAYAEPDYIRRVAAIPNDPLFSLQWGMSTITAPAAWDVTHGSAAVKIAILDCGIHESHPDLAGKVVLRSDFSGSSGTDDFCDHGTHVAGIASANTNNTIGVAGVGFDTSLMNGKVLDDTGTGSESSVAQGIHWATDNGAKVINLSLGGDGSCSSTEQEAVNYAWAHNVVLVAAAGNTGSSSPFSPASCPHAVGVASTDSNDGKSSFSAFGSLVQIAAPGGRDSSGHGIYSSLNTGAYGYMQGTSMATPFVAGLAGLLWGTGHYDTAQSVINRLEITADRIPGTGAFWQYGRINASAAVSTNPAPAPTVSGVTPAVGSSAGGTSVTITGNNFVSGATVSFGGTPATNVTVTGLTSITVTAPAHMSGQVNVVVTNADGQSGTLANALVYNQTVAGLQYYSLPNPIRLLDTRAGFAACVQRGTPLMSGVPLGLNARTPCTGIAGSAQAVVGNATVVNKDTNAPAGFATLYPGGTAVPGTSNLNYVAGQVIANAFTVGLASDGSFNAYATTGVDFVIDLTGFYAPPGTGGLYFHPLPSPIRLLDTRVGGTGCTHPSAPLSAGGTLTVAARISCTGVPASALAVSGNATVVNSAIDASAGYATVYPSGVGLPNASNLNYLAGQVVPNAFIVGLGSDGAFNGYATTSVDLIIDLTGYYDTMSSGGLVFNALTTPVRLLDTRPGFSGCTTSGTPLTAHVSLDLSARTPCTTVPGGARAVVGNATAINNLTSLPGYITLYPGGAGLPATSNLNYIAGQVVPNAFMVGLDSTGVMSIYATTAIDCVIDLTGYFV